jgi:hypothetical protein
MNIPRHVVLDLLPLYVSGDVSPETKAFIDQYVADDAELAAQLAQLRAADELGMERGPRPPPELALRSLQRTRLVLAWQKWLFAFGMFFTFVGCSFEISFDGGRVQEWHLLLRDSPWMFGGSLVLGGICWAAYLAIRRR